MHIRLILFVILVLIIKTGKCQDFDKCKVDFFLLESQKTFTERDIGKQFIINKAKLPSYEFVQKNNKTMQELHTELAEKINDNRDYNRNDEKIRDSLFATYRYLMEEIGLTLIWYDSVGVITKEELKEFEKSIKKEVIDPGTAWSHESTTFTSTKFITPYELNFFLSYYGTEKSGKEINSKNCQGVVAPNDFSKTKERYNQIKSFPEIIFIVGQTKYKITTKTLPCKTPIFTLQQQSSQKEPQISTYLTPIYYETYFIKFPIGLKPIFDLAPHLNSNIKLVALKTDKFSSTIPRDPIQLDFDVDNKYRLSVYNFRFRKVDEYLIDKSLEIFYDKKKLEKIDEFLSTLKDKRLVIQENGNEYANPVLTNLSYNLNTLTINYSFDGKEHSKTYFSRLDTKYNYDAAWPNKTYFDLPIYYSDCYSEGLKTFNNLTLPNDKVNDPALKKQLLEALTTSIDWKNFIIEKVILTNNSVWTVLLNQYTGLQDSRVILADVYVKSNINEKCYYQQDVYFYQKADPIRGFIYYLYVEEPSILQPYPCNLK